MKAGTHKAYWKINNACNFRCKYCFFDNHREHPQVGKHTAKEITEAFDDTGVVWTIVIDGGEPFLYPGIVDLLTGLTDNHYVVLVTNLSRSAQIREFSDRIPAEKVLRIGTSVHIEERERLGLVNSYIENFLMLKEKGFAMYATYVVYPSLFSRIEDDFEFFQSNGIIISPVPFRGIYNGKQYPESYSEKEKRIFRSLAPAGSVHVSLLKGRSSFKGRYCYAGSRLIDINEGGLVSICVSALVYKQITLGNFFSKETTLLKQMRVCTFEYCSCPHEGLEFSIDKRAHFLRYLEEKVSDEWFCVKRKTNHVLDKYLYWRFRERR